MLYRGLARGQMSVVGPVSAVGAAVVPAAAGIAMGERPGVLAVAGVLVALPAIVLAAASGSVRRPAPADPTASPPAWPSASCSSVSRRPAWTPAGLWPVASEQTGALLPVLAVAVKSRQPLRIPVAWPARAGGR